jgi:hypothetical protein
MLEPMALREDLDPVHHHLCEAANALSKALGSVAPTDMPKLLNVVEALSTAQRLLLELAHDTDARSSD